MKQLINIAITIAISFAVIAGLIWLSRTAPPKKSSATSRGLLEASETFFNFGEISMAQGKVSRNFPIKNSGSESIELNTLYTSCMCTTASFIKAGSRFGPFGMPGHGFVPPLNQSLTPGEEAGVEVVFDPAAHGPAGVGPIERVVYLENNAGRPLELKFRAVVTP
ncbi:DUF1573 domain-containing protein [Candidatus Wolfebacteria bacterium]|nr:DUF1573 domain-containing protein [Candidatus Wolfebacteria bacterium]